jgi:hypothetical protein
MVRGGQTTAAQSDNRAKSRIATHGQNTKNRHINRSQQVRNNNQQQQALGEPVDTLLLGQKPNHRRKITMKKKKKTARKRLV